MSDMDPQKRKKLQMRFDRKDHKIYNQVTDIVRDSYSDVSLDDHSTSIKRRIKHKKQQKHQEFDKLISGVTHDVNLRAG